MNNHSSQRQTLVPLSIAAVMVCFFVLVAFSSAGSAKEKSCELCNDKGYCLSFEDRGSCQANKSVVEKKWDPSLKWKCSCSHTKTKVPKEPDNAACCWVSDNPASKICGSESKIRRALVVSNPGKLIECGPP